MGRPDVRVGLPCASGSRTRQPRLGSRRAFRSTPGPTRRKEPIDRIAGITRCCRARRWGTERGDGTSARISSSPGHRTYALRNASSEPMRSPASGSGWSLAVIPCGVWEAVHLLQGLLDNTSEVQPEIIHTDTQGHVPAGVRTGLGTGVRAAAAHPELAGPDLLPASPDHALPAHRPASCWPTVRSTPRPWT